MQYKKEFETFQALSVQGRKELVLELLGKIRHTSEVLENIFQYITQSESVSEAELQEVFIGILSGIKSMDETEERAANEQLREIGELLKKRREMEDQEAIEEQKEAQNTIHTLSL